MNISITRIHPDEDDYSIARAIATILHGQDHDGRKVNFKVKLNPNKAGGVGHDGTGTLTLPQKHIGEKLLLAVRERPLVLNSRKVFFKASRSRPERSLVATLDRTPFVDPDIEEKHIKVLVDLEEHIRVEVVQFGVFFRPDYAHGARAFSVEWEREYVKKSAATLSVEYNHKLLKLTLGNNLTEHRGYNIKINFSSIRKMGLGSDCSKPYICFDLLFPPTIEEFDFNRSTTGNNRQDFDKSKRRIDSLDAKHSTVGPYATDLRLVLATYDADVRFVDLCRTAGIADLVAWFVGPLSPQIITVRKGFFEHKKLYALHRRLQRLPWSVAFQMEGLLRNGLLHTEMINIVVPKVEDLVKQHQDSHYVAELLRHYHEALQARSMANNREHPLDVFELVKNTFDYLGPTVGRGYFLCSHITITPTRMLLEGPIPTQSNRVIRQYEDHQDHFIRVDFKDEDRLQYRWDREVDGGTFLRSKVKPILKEGFELAGRRFEFLAYSSSALRQHTVWFMCPFKDKGGVQIDSEYIRNTLGDFHGTDLIKCPSKYAARLAQAFTATHPSVRIRRDEWEEIPDMGEDPYLFTDGCGTISQALADRIWEHIKDDGDRIRVRPDAVCASAIDPQQLERFDALKFQIRFLGYKGVVAVDKELDKISGPIQMRLRPSMRKFENKRANEAEIEIAQAFYAPNVCYLNRSVYEARSSLSAK